MIGEWWISSHGDVEYADGDVGDANHELIACQHALHEVADRLGYDVDVEQGDTLISVLELYGSEHEIGMPGDPAAELAARWDAVEAVLRGLMVPEPGTLLNIANGQGDSRAYACQHWGWKAVRGNHVESWTLTKDDLEMIARGIGQILDMFSYDDHEDVLDVGCGTGNLAFAVGARAGPC